MFNTINDMGRSNEMTNALKLFVLRHGKGGAIVKGDDGKPLYFTDKQHAKKARGDNQVVSYGPDHRKFRGDN
jgi:hypothetical protein